MVGFREIRSLRYSALAGVVGLGACTSVLGIDDLHQEERPGTGGEGATGATANNGGVNSKAGSGGNDSAGAGEGGAGASTAAGTNNGGNAGTNNGGTTGDAGAGGEPPTTQDPTVHGTLIDFWGKPLGNIVVKLGEETIATDKDGQFTFENVPAEYDLALTVTTELGTHVHGWYFQGITRRDPTLQVYQARDETYTTAYLKATSPALLTNDTISAAIGGSDGNTEKKNLTPNDAGGNYFTPNWVGGATTQATAHAVLWSKSAATGLPSAYKGYDSKLVALQEGTDPDITFNLAAKTITDGDITGSVTPYGNADRNNAVFLRFESGASIRVASHTPTGNAFQYKVPTLPKCSITLAASEGDSVGAYGLVHEDGLSPGADAGTLKIPAPATPTKPTTSLDMVDNASEFAFASSADNKGGFVIHVEATKFYQDLHIVTSKKKFTLPIVPGFEWISDRVFYWQIETHGDLASVDQMTGPNGFADAFTGPNQFSNNDAPQGVRQQSGSFTQSARAFFTFK